MFETEGLIIRIKYWKTQRFVKVDLFPTSGGGE
jgi:hypothetical protein